jgi:hypothetical protein
MDLAGRKFLESVRPARQSAIKNHLLKRRRLARTFFRYPLTTELAVLPVATFAAVSAIAITFSATIRFASRGAAEPPSVNLKNRKAMTCWLSMVNIDVSMTSFIHAANVKSPSVVAHLLGRTAKGPPPADGAQFSHSTLAGILATDMSGCATWSSSCAAFCSSPSDIVSSWTIAG